MRLSKRTLRAIGLRDGARCAICGLTVHRSHSHHRRPRGMGGSTDTVSDSPANVVRTHPSCHGVVESNRRASFINGWLVPQGTDPATVPFLYRGLGWVLLTHDGEVVQTQQPDRAQVTVSILESDTSP